MLNHSILKGLFLFLLCFFIFECKKAELKPEYNYKVEQTPPISIGDDRSDLYPSVSVVNGLLRFSSLSVYDSIRAKLERSTIDQNISWSDSLGFKSIRYFYNKALKSSVCESDDCNASFPQAYIGKVKMTVDSFNNFEPLLPYITNGWILNTDGNFLVGSTLIHFDENYIYSIKDADFSKLQTAITTKQSDEDNGVFVHTTEVDDRAACDCPQELNCPIVTSSSGLKRIKKAQSFVRDESFSIYDNLINAYVTSVSYTYNVSLHHQRRRFTWGSWSICQRTTWSFTGSVTMRWLGPTFTPFGGGSNVMYNQPFSHNVSIPITGNECKYDYGTVLFGYTSVPLSIYRMRSFCIEKQRLSATANDSGLSTAASCGQ